jgi:hypothetical protein
MLRVKLERQVREHLLEFLHRLVLLVLRTPYPLELLEILQLLRNHPPLERIDLQHVRVEPLTDQLTRVPARQNEPIQSIPEIP